MLVQQTLIHLPRHDVYEVMLQKTLDIYKPVTYQKQLGDRLIQESGFTYIYIWGKLKEDSHAPRFSMLVLQCHNLIEEDEL